MDSGLSIHNFTNVSASHSKGNDYGNVLTMRFWTENDSSTQVVTIFFGDDKLDKKLLEAIQAVMASTEKMASA